MLKILIAEDEEPIANLIRVNLTRAGYECTCACDGEEAADQMENGHFDLLLLDIMLPKINGYELMEYAKTLQLPVIFITAMGTTEHKVKGLKMGAEDYISKPFEIVELLHGFLPQSRYLFQEGCSQSRAHEYPVPWLSHHCQIQGFRHTWHDQHRQYMQYHHRRG